ncbi:MAG: hypothetical protein JO197_02765 [Acidobacteria bacterium]|nr:hypothetical protein [Acidobacteriota bacterium]MBV9476697.1 hypothetical protein [Acidobacteriota bacterium]
MSSNGSRRLVSAFVAALFVAAVIDGLIALSTDIAYSYGVALFLLVPFVIGFSTTALLAITAPRTLGFSVLISLLSGALVVFGMLLMQREGLVCALMASPIGIPFVIGGAATSYGFFHKRRVPGGGTAAILAFVLAAGAIVLEASVRRASSPVYSVADSIVVDASRAEVWRTIVALGEVRPAKGDLLFRAGIACPLQTRIARGSVGGLRVCTLTTGTLIERIDVWQPGQRLAWRALSTPPPLHELNPFGEVDPPHLHGFYRNIRGEFVIESLGPRRTRVTRRTWYQHDLFPAAYWRIWCDFGASKIQRFVLEEVRRRAEGLPI